MTIEFRCPNCEKLLRTSDDKAGRTAKCPDCGNPVKIPAPAADDEFGAFDDDAPDEDVLSRRPPARVVRPGASGMGTKTCPMCGETIKAAATHCRYCGEDLAGGGSYAAMPTHIDAGEVISTSWAIYKSQFGMVVGGSVIVVLASGGINYAVNAVVGLMLPARVNQQFDPTLVVAVLSSWALSWAAQLILQIGLHMFLLKIARGQQVEIGDIFQGGRFYLRALASGALFGLMWMLGAVALIVPAIFVGLIFWPHLYVLVDSDPPGIECLWRAKELTAGNWAAAFVLTLTFIGLVVLGLMMCCVGTIFTAPLGSLTFAVAYCRMTGQRTAAV